MYNLPMHSISIIIPCYNEENNLKRGVLDQVKKYLDNIKFDWEVLICNDASTDKSLELITSFSKKNPRFKVIDLPHGGKPSAILGGIKAATKDIVLFTDMDQSTPIKELDKLLPFYDKGFNVVIGSRGISREGNSIVRKIMSRVFLLTRKFVILSNIIDTQCGFKTFKTTVAKDLFPKLDFFKNDNNKTGWRVSAFDVELLFMANKANLKIKEVTVDWSNEDTSNTKGDNSERFRRESVQMIQEIIRVKINNVKGTYDYLKKQNTK